MLRCSRLQSPVAFCTRLLRRTPAGFSSPLQSSTKHKKGTIKVPSLCLAEKRGYSAPSGISHRGSAVPGNAALLETSESGCFLHPAPTTNPCGLLIPALIFRQQKNPSEWMDFFVGGEAGIRTPAPVTRPNDLANRPLQPTWVLLQNGIHYSNILRTRQVIN